jgi:hypothetical protein
LPRQGVEIREIPLGPSRLWELIADADSADVGSADGRRPHRLDNS